MGFIVCMLSFNSKAYAGDWHSNPQWQVYNNFSTVGGSIIGNKDNTPQVTSDMNKYPPLPSAQCTNISDEDVEDDTINGYANLTISDTRTQYSSWFVNSCYGPLFDYLGQPNTGSDVQAESVNFVNYLDANYSDKLDYTKIFICTGDSEHHIRDAKAISESYYKTYGNSKIPIIYLRYNSSDAITEGLAESILDLYSKHKTSDIINLVYQGDTTGTVTFYILEGEN